MKIKRINKLASFILYYFIIYIYVIFCLNFINSLNIFILKILFKKFGNMEINFILSLHENVTKNISINAFLYTIYSWVTLAIGGHHLRC